MTGIWPRVPRRFWHVGPMARSIRDLVLAFSQLAGPDGQDGYSSSAVPLDNGLGSSHERPLRVGWLVEPGFGPIDRETAATVQAAAEALKDFGHTVEQCREAGLPVLLEENSGPDTMPWLAWNFIGEEKAHGVLIELATRYQTVGDKWMPHPGNAENAALREELVKRYYC